MGNNEGDEGAGSPPGSDEADDSVEDSPLPGVDDDATPEQVRRRVEEADRRAAEAEEAVTHPAGGEDQAQFGEPSAGFFGELGLEAEDFGEAAEASGLDPEDVGEVLTPENYVPIPRPDFWEYEVEDAIGIQEDHFRDEMEARRDEQRRVTIEQEGSMEGRRQLRIPDDLPDDWTPVETAIPSQMEDPDLSWSPPDEFTEALILLERRNAGEELTPDEIRLLERVDEEHDITGDRLEAELLERATDFDKHGPRPVQETDQPAPPVSRRLIPVSIAVAVGLVVVGLAVVLSGGEEPAEVPVNVGAVSPPVNEAGTPEPAEPVAPAVEESEPPADPPDDAVSSADTGNTGAADPALASTGFLTGTLAFSSDSGDQTFESGVDFLIRPDPAGTDIDDTAIQLLGSVDEWLATNPAFQIDPRPEIGPFVTLAQFQPGGASQSTYGRLLDGDGLRAILAGSGDKYTEFYLLDFSPCSGFPDTCQTISVDGWNLGLADLDVAAGLDIVAAMSDGWAAPDGALWAFTVTGTMNVLGTSTEAESATP